MKNKKTQREEMRVELNDNFRKELFAKLFRKYPTRILMKEINMAQGTLYHYKNKRIPTIPIRLVKDFIQRADIDKRKLNSNIINITTTEKIRHKGLNIGRTKRKNQLKKWRREIPTINEIVDKNHLNLERWLKYYIKLINFGCRKFESVNKDNDKIILKYTNYSKGKKKKFTTNLPTKLNIDIDFQYFFGLWCGDRAGGGRVGILNKELELIYFAKKYLKKLKQNTKTIIFKSSLLKKLPYPDIVIDNIVNVKNMKGDYVFSTFSINGILRSFFHYLLKNLDDVLNILPNKNIFFAGLFDAEGNVFLEDRCFRWSCKNEEEVKIYRKYLSEYGLFHRYDGCNLVSNDIKLFKKLIFPYIKHKEKINKIRLITEKRGKLGIMFINILDIINRYPGKKAPELAKMLNKKKIYAQLKLLSDLNYIYYNKYPKRFYMTDKGSKEVSGYDLPD